MTKNISFSVRLDSKIKADAEELFAELGLSLGSAVNVFLCQSLRVKGLPFSIRLGKGEEPAPQEEPPARAESKTAEPATEPAAEPVAEPPERD